MSIVAHLEQASLRQEQELAALVAQASGDGAVVSFVGLARAESKSGGPVERLILEHHSILTQQSLNEKVAGC